MVDDVQKIHVVVYSGRMRVHYYYPLSVGWFSAAYRSLARWCRAGCLGSYLISIDNVVASFPASRRHLYCELQRVHSAYKDVIRRKIYDLRKY
jgi:hypothetical protein